MCVCVSVLYLRDRSWHRSAWDWIARTDANTVFCDGFSDITSSTRDFQAIPSRNTGMFLFFSVFFFKSAVVCSMGGKLQSCSSFGCNSLIGFRSIYLLERWLECYLPPRKDSLHSLSIKGPLGCHDGSAFH